MPRYWLPLFDISDIAHRKTNEKTLPDATIKPARLIQFLKFRARLKGPVGDGFIGEIEGV
jgi:hypothetical protein